MGVLRLATILLMAEGFTSSKDLGLLLILSFTRLSQRLSIGTSLLRSSVIFGGADSQAKSLAFIYLFVFEGRHTQ